jgi:hypothetical protein
MTWEQLEGRSEAEELLAGLVSSSGTQGLFTKL